MNEQEEIILNVKCHKEKSNIIPDIKKKSVSEIKN